MTKYKFWLVWSDTLGNSLNPTHSTFEEAKKQAKRLTEKHREYHKFYVLEPKCFFSINELIVETDLKATKNDFVELAESTPEESLAVEPKFKVGDKVNVFDNFTQQTALCTVEKVIIDKSDISYEIKNNLGTDIKPESCLTLTEPTEIPKREQSD